MVDGIDVSITCLANTAKTGGDKRCLALGHTCERQHAAGRSRFVLVDPNGKEWKSSDFRACLTDAVRIAQQFGDPKKDEKPPEKPATSTPPSQKPATESASKPAKSYSVCEKAGKSGSQKNGTCRRIIDACHSLTSWPVTILTNDGSSTRRNDAQSYAQCSTLAWILAKGGKRFVRTERGKPRPGPAKRSSGSTPAAGAPKPAPQPEKPPAARPSAPAKPAPAPAPKPEKAPSPGPKPKADCEKAGKQGSDERGYCYQISDACNVITGWPYTLTFLRGSESRRLTLANAAQCMGLAVIMAKNGFRVTATGIRSRARPSTMAPANSNEDKKDNDVCPGAPHINVDPSNPRKRFYRRHDSQPLVLNRAQNHYYSERSRRQGELDMRKLCNSENYEDHFLFIEGRIEGHKRASFWYEVGICEEPTRTSIKFNSTFSKGVMSEFAEVTSYSLYHFHPRQSYTDVGSLYPSPADFKAVIERALQSGDLRMGYPAGIYDHRVVTDSGVWRLKPDFGKIRANRNGARAALERYSREFAKIDSPAYSSGTRAGNGAKFARAVTSEYIEVTFQPF